MKFSKDYSKLNCRIFTTIRKNLGYYKEGTVISIRTLNDTFSAEILSIRKIQKHNITEIIAMRDAECSKKKLINMLESWYGKSYNDFILITLGVTLTVSEIKELYEPR